MSAATAIDHADTPLEALIDLDRFPLHRPDHRRVLIADCRDQLDRLGCARLPGFVRPEAVAAMAAESRALAPRAHFNSGRTNPYNTAGDPDLPEHHPVNTFGDRSNGFVAGDLIGTGTAIRRLYHAPAFQRFLAATMGVERLYEYADPLAGLVINVLRPGCQHPWHYDTNEFVVSMLTQAPEAGGDFEYCPGIRSPQDECYDEVARVLQGDRAAVRTPSLQPGDLQIFYGRYSLHRVDRVAGERERHSVIFGYAREPGMIGRATRTRRLFGRVAPIHERRDAVRRSDTLAD
ncbi:MAG: hypothetical protein R3202_02765 [Candidatus Competibacterales bacterium]|nr:hypothetical protein [Candidatus Competibacterales bacterium]